MKNKEETETEIIIEGDLILEANFKTEKKLIVTGNIFGKDGKRWNIDARNINALDIDAWDIICETRKKKSETAKTKARIYIKNKSQIERKEYED